MTEPIDKAAGAKMIRFLPETYVHNSIPDSVETAAKTLLFALDPEARARILHPFGLASLTGTLEAEAKAARLETELTTARAEVSRLTARVAELEKRPTLAAALGSDEPWLQEKP